MYKGLIIIINIIMIKLHIYIVYSQYLEKRMKYINSTIDFIKKKAETIGYKCVIKIITEPSKEFIDDNIDFYNKRVQYEKYPEDDMVNREFNSLIQPLNSNQISNIEKHREIYKIIVNNDIEKNDIHLILEDDVVIGQDYTGNVEQFLRGLFKNTFEEWDIVFTCLPPLNSDGEMRLISTHEKFKNIFSKSSYIIKPSVAKELFEYTEKFKFTLKNSISRFLYENKNIKSMYLNKHTFLEGSKIGILPSSTNPNNFLFQNNQFINLTNISNKNDISNDDIIEANRLYDIVSNMDSPDILHIMGIIYYKNKNYEKSKQFLVDAVSSAKRNNGYLNKNSEILNNCINMHQYDQIYLEECKKCPSKY